MGLSASLAKLGLDKVKSAEQRGEGEGEGGSDKTSSASFKILKLYGNVSTNSASC